MDSYAQTGLILFLSKFCLTMHCFSMKFCGDTSGTELNAILPKMSPLNPQYLTKKQSVFQKIAAFVEKFKGVGGQV